MKTEREEGELIHAWGAALCSVVRSPLNQYAAIFRNSEEKVSIVLVRDLRACQSEMAAAVAK